MPAMFRFLPVPGRSGRNTGSMRTDALAGRMFPAFADVRAQVESPARSGRCGRVLRYQPLCRRGVTIRIAAFRHTITRKGAPVAGKNDNSGKGKYRSAQWFGRTDRDGLVHRSWMKNQGLPHHLFDGRPVIGICNTWSELTPCNAHFRIIAERVKRGVYEMGGFPLEFPVMSLGETLMRPTTMLFRNLASMDVEESIRANPIDGVVLLTGCDKTTPSLMMGAASCDLPSIVVSGGPMLNGKFRGEDIGSGTNVWSMSEDVRAGKMSLADFMDAEAGM